MSKIYLDLREALSAPFTEEDLVMIEVNGISEPAVSFDAINKRLEELTGEPLRIYIMNVEATLDSGLHTVIINGTTTLAGVSTPTTMGIGEDQSKATAYNKAYGSLFARLSQFLGMRPSLEQKNVAKPPVTAQEDFGTERAVAAAMQKVDKIRMKAQEGITQEEVVQSEAKEEETQEGIELANLIKIESKHPDVALSAIPAIFSPKIYLELGDMSVPDSKAKLKEWGIDVEEKGKDVKRWSKKYSQDIYADYYGLTPSEVTKAIANYNRDTLEGEYIEKVSEKVKEAEMPLVQELTPEQKDETVFEEVEELSFDDEPIEDMRLEQERAMTELIPVLNSMKSMTIDGNPVCIAGTNDYIRLMPKWVQDQFPSFTDFAKYAKPEVFEAIK
jgi:hypothetical protein